MVQPTGNQIFLIFLRGGAYGYKLDILTKLNDFKTNDNKKTLLNYIIEHIYENKIEELLEITSDFANLSDSNLII